MSIIERRSLISPEHNTLIAGQCKLLYLQRSCYYFKPEGEFLFNQSMMSVIDRKFWGCPFYGVERMTAYLNKDLGYHVNAKRVRRLYIFMFAGSHNAATRAGMLYSFLAICKKALGESPPMVNIHTAKRYVDQP